MPLKVKKWKCSVCGYIHTGNKPPTECPQCSSSAGEYSEFKRKKQLIYNGNKLDVLLINGSTHRSHNTGILVDIAEKEIIERKLRYKRFDLNSLDIMHCWCCYSMRDSACTYPCRNQIDDMPALHEMIINSRAVIIASPINWNNMSARLKDFLDRLTSIQNLPLLGKESLTTNKTLGIMINGHEDGASKTAMDIFFYFQQMGYILAPYGYLYRTHGASHNADEDYSFIKKDEKLKIEIQSLVNNINAVLNVNLEKKLKGKIKPVCE